MEVLDRLSLERFQSLKAETTFEWQELYFIPSWKFRQCENGSYRVPGLTENSILRPIKEIPNLAPHRLLWALDAPYEDW